MRRLVITIVTLSMLLSAAPATAAASEAAHTPMVAGGTVTVESSVTGRVRIQVPEEATVDTHTGLAVEGEGRFIGLLLTEPGTRDGFFVEIIRYPTSLDFTRKATRGRKAAEDREQSDDPLAPPSGISCETCRVPPGEYDLYVIADGKPVSGSLQLAGLSGVTSVTPDSLTPVDSWQHDGQEREGEAGLLGQGASASLMCCFDAPEGGVAYGQFTTMTTGTLAHSRHTFCVRSAAAEDCDLGMSWHDHLTTSSTRTNWGYHTRDLGPGSYAQSSSFTYRSATDLQWTLDTNVLFLAW